MKINYKTTGFLKDASYSFYLYSFLSDYKNSFKGADSLTLNLEEIRIDRSKKESIVISPDGKTIEINVSDSKYLDKNGNISSVPSPEEIFSTLRFVLDKAVQRYAIQFPNN